MIHPRVLFLGDPAAATPWVGIAKKLARACYGLKIANKVYHLGSGVTIRVENIFPIAGKLAGISKVWIEAKLSGLHGFQFIYSGYTAEYYTTDKFVAAMKGSAVWVPLSRIEYIQGAWTLPDWSVAISEATGSTIELLPGMTTIDEEIQKIQKVHNLVQVNLIPEPLFLAYSDLNKPPIRKVATAWNATEGEIYNFGVFSGFFVGTLTDIGYDLHPTPVARRKPRVRAPESDWPDNCGVQIVSSEAYGNRRFLILVDASGTFHCWQDSYEGYENLTPPGSPYASQSYRVTVPSEQVKTEAPPYPDWVYRFPSGYARRDSDFPHPASISPEPRYVWRFSPDGKKVVGHLLSRDNTPFTVSAMNAGDIVSTPYELMRLQTDSTAYDGGKEDWHDVVMDIPGWAEFSLNISLTGSGRNDFTFSMSLLRDAVAGEQYPIAAGYAGPCYLGWESRGLSVSPGDLIVLDLRVYTDEDTEQQIADLGNVYSGVATDTTKKAIVGVYNVDTSQDLLKFNVHETPDGYYLNRFNFKSMGSYEYTARFLHIDISTLSFVVRAEYDSFTIGSGYYNFTTNDGTGGSGVQRWMEMEVGTRVIVYGQTVYEERHGGDFDVLDKIDSTESTIKLTLSKTGCRRFNSSIIPLWSAVNLLNSFCYLMAKYMPLKTDPDPLYDKNDPCAEWTDYWEVTRETTLSFVGEVAPAVKNELPDPLTDLNPAYTTEYWNTYIIPKAWEIYNKTQDMRAAGDTLPDRNVSSAYRHAVSPYSYAVYPYDDNWLKSYTSSTINHHIIDYPVGKESYGYIWSAIDCNDARFSLQVSWDGYYSLWLYDRHVSGTIPQLTFHVATISQESLARTEIGLSHVSANDSQYSKANKPSADQFKFTNTSFLSHIASDTRLLHAELYGTAYGKTAATLHNPSVTIEDDNYSYYYTTQQDVKLDGVEHESESAFFSYAHDVMNPVLVGSAYFIDY